MTTKDTVQGYFTRLQQKEEWELLLFNDMLIAHRFRNRCVITYRSDSFRAAVVS